MILVGEMRDEETVRTALSAAETGHLVLSTIHTVDAAESVNRIIDFFPQAKQRQARAMLAGTLKGVDLPAARADARRERPRRGLRDPADDRPRARHDHGPGRDREAARGDRRGRLLRHADLRPGAAATTCRRAGSTMEEALKAATRPHDFKLLVAPTASAAPRSSRCSRPSGSRARVPRVGRRGRLQCRRRSLTRRVKEARCRAPSASSRRPSRAGVRAPELEAAEGQPRPGHDPGQAGSMVAYQGDVTFEHAGSGGMAGWSRRRSPARARSS